MQVFRIEKPTGEGPWRSDAASICYKECPRTKKCPQHMPIPRWIHISVHPSLKLTGDNNNAIFGFKSEEDLHRWFSSYHLELLQVAGLRIRIYSCPKEFVDCEHSGGQCVFSRSDSTILHDLDPIDLVREEVFA